MTEELRAAQSLLKRGIRYNVPAPFFLSLLGFRHVSITITQLCAGTELKMAAIIAEKSLTEEKIKTSDPGKLMLEHYTDILKLVAIASLNRRYISRLRLWFRMYLLRSISAWQLLELYTMIRQFSGTTSFINITRLAVATRITAPNLGQMATGS
jgi:hypothetical protein